MKKTRMKTATPDPITAAKRPSSRSKLHTSAKRTRLRAKASSGTVKQRPSGLLAEHYTDSDFCRIEFQLYQPGASEVFLAGTFNQWDPKATPLRRQPNGQWITAVMLKPGEYEYKFVIDGNWQTDPLSSRLVPNSFDGFNSLVEVKVFRG